MDTLASDGGGSSSEVDAFRIAIRHRRKTFTGGLRNAGMPKPYVKVLSDPKSGQTTGDWIVEYGTRHVSRHRTKSAAVERAKQKARSKDTQVRIQRTDGTFRQGPSYG